MVQGYLTTKEAAKKLNLSSRRVLQLIASGQLPAEKVGRTYRIKETDLGLARSRRKPRQSKKTKRQTEKQLTPEVTELGDAVDREIELCDDFLDGVKLLSDVVPDVEERKRRARAKKLAVEVFPVDLLSEVAPKFLYLQLAEVERLENSLPCLPDKVIPVSSTNTSGTMSAFVTIMSSPATIYLSDNDENSLWGGVQNVFTQIVEEGTTIEKLPTRLEKIRQGLGDLFNDAEDSYQKSKSGLLGVDQAASRMRNVLQQIWGNLADHARRLCGETMQDISRFKFATSKHRMRIADCLAPEDMKKNLVSILDNMHGLYSVLSSVTKYPERGYSSKIEKFHTNWILQLDELMTIVFERL